MTTLVENYDINIRRAILKNHHQNKCIKCNGILNDSKVGNIHYRCMNGYGHYCRFPTEENEIVNIWCGVYSTSVQEIRQIFEKGISISEIDQFIRVLITWRKYFGHSIEIIQKVYELYQKTTTLRSDVLDKILSDIFSEFPKESSAKVLEKFQERIKIKIEEKINNIVDLWVLERCEFDNRIQWLPQEMIEDTLELFNA